MMKKSKLIILLVLGSYLLLLAHLSLPVVNDFLFMNPVEHAHSADGICLSTSSHSSEHHSHDDEDEHHCVYCCGHNKSLEFTNNSKTYTPEQVIQVMHIVKEYAEFEEIKPSESNQVYLQNVFRFPKSDHLISPNNFRAPPQV